MQKWWNAKGYNNSFGLELVDIISVLTFTRWLPFCATKVDLYNLNDYLGCTLVTGAY